MSDKTPKKNKSKEELFLLIFVASGCNQAGSPHTLKVQRTGPSAEEALGVTDMNMP